MTILSALALLAAVLAVLPAQAASGDLFTVRDIKVDVTADSAAAAIDLIVVMPLPALMITGVNHGAPAAHTRVHPNGPVGTAVCRAPSPRHGGARVTQVS